MTGPGLRPIAALTLLAGFLIPPALAEKPGDRFFIDPDKMAEPYASSSAVNPSSRSSKPSAAALELPPGFTVNLFADKLQHARNIKTAPDSTVFLAQANRGRIVALKDTNGDGKADQRDYFLRGLNRPHGMALHKGWLYVADLDYVRRVPWQPGQRVAGETLEKLTPEGALGPGTGHWTRNLTISPDGKWLYVSIGSRGNIGEEPLPRASIQRFELKPDGTLGRQDTFAAGLRNPVGVGFHPGNGKLYTVVNERDGMGDGLVPDYFTSVKEGGFYGWPYAYIGPNPMPGQAEKAPDLVKASLVPDVLIRSHSAPLGLTFLDQANVPSDWKDDALVTLHGSWNAADATGYKLIRVPFENGEPTGEYINFLTGFHLNPGAKDQSASVWGRPVGLAVLPDGSILMSEDANHTIWRISRN